ncbi:MAG: lieA, partial [Verrucomicrobiales bacterium]|nr:lieA [Verrucomicrobiales bacterium]
MFLRRPLRLLFFLVLIDATRGAEWTVPGQFSTIQATLTVANNKDIIWLKPGVYAENLNFEGKDIALRSLEGPKETILNAQQNTGILIGPLGELSGITISNAFAYFGAGMEVHGTGTIIRSNVFIKNIQASGGFGAGIAGNAASPIIEQNIFLFNSGDSQLLSGVITFVNGSSPRIINNLFVSNSCAALNLALPEGNTPLVENNTIVANTAGIHHYSSSIIT